MHTPHGYMPASKVLLVLFRGQGMAQHPLWVVLGVRGTPQYLHELFLGSWGTAVLPLIFSSGPWEAPIPPWVGPEVRGHPYTHEVSLGARGQPQYLLELILGSRAPL